MFKAPFITTELLALRRAHSSAKEHAYRLHAFCAAEWPAEFSYFFVEEEAREAFAMLSINIRRAVEISKIKELPKVPAYTSKAPGVLEELNIKRIFDVGAHLQWFKLHLSFEGAVGDLVAKSDRIAIQVNPLKFVQACLAALAIQTPDEFDAEQIRLANSEIIGGQ